MTAHKDDGSLDGVFVASEFGRHDRLLLVEPEQIALLFEKVGGDYPSEWHGRFDGQDWKIVQR